MVSFDVESLFTNIPTNDTIDIIIKDLYNDNKLKTIMKITQNNMQKLLKICTQESHFICNNESYEQIDGVAIGSPLGHLFANWFLKDVESKFIEKDRHKLGIQLWKRYVDDVLAIVKNNEANNILQYLNRKHDSIKFTMCMTEQSKLQFLDMVVISDQTKQHYYTDIYHKPTDTGLYSLYDSYVPAEYKLGTLNALLHTAWKICTNYNQFYVEVNKIRDKFNKLCNPKFILDKYVKHFVEKKIVATTDETTNNKRDEIIIRLP